MKTLTTMKTTTKISKKNILLLAMIILVFASCAPGNERYEVVQAGFWMGLWHGFIGLVKINQDYNKKFTWIRA